MTVAAARVATIEVGGTPTTFTSEELEVLSGFSMVLVDNTKNVFDPNTAMVLVDEEVPETVPASEYSVDYARGIVTLVGDGVGRAGNTFRLSGKFIPHMPVAEAESCKADYGPVFAEGTRLGDTASRMHKTHDHCDLELSHFHAPNDELLEGDVATIDSLISGGGPFFVSAHIAGGYVVGWFAVEDADAPHSLEGLLKQTLKLKGVVQKCVGRPDTDQALFSYPT